MRITAVFLVGICLAGCAAPGQREVGPVHVVASPYEPAAQFGSGIDGTPAEGAVLGAAGGAGIGALSAKASAGLLCTIGGPLCWVVMIPAAIVGGVVGGLAGGVADAVTSQPSERVVAARGAIEQAVAEMRLTDALAARLREENASAASRYTLEVEVTDLQFLAREKDLALALHARSRLYRDGELLDERRAHTETDYRRYEAWAAEEVEPLRRAVAHALARLSEDLSPR